MMWFSGLIAVLWVGSARCAWEERTVVPLRLDPEREARAYRLDVFGKRLVLQLEPDQTFLAPGFVFHVVGRSPDPTGGPPEPSRAEPGCFFSGTVNGEERSAAALNLCGGLTGGFFFQGEEYFIQPLNSSALQEEEREEREEVHVVRRRSRAALAEEGSSKCGVSEDEERVPRNLEEGAKRGQTGKSAHLLNFTTPFITKQTNKHKLKVSWSRVGLSYFLTALSERRENSRKRGRSRGGGGSNTPSLPGTHCPDRSEPLSTWHHCSQRMWSLKRRCQVPGYF